jgi:hypothetical protein
MPTTNSTTNPTQCARGLAAWIDRLNLPSALRTTLLRDLHGVMHPRAGAGPSGHLRGLDPTAFRIQLARPGGGVVARVRGMGAGRIAALRDLLAASDEHTVA